MGEPVGARRKHHGPDPVPGLDQPVGLESPVRGPHRVDVRAELIGQRAYRGKLGSRLELAVRDEEGDVRTDLTSDPESGGGIQPDR